MGGEGTERNPHLGAIWFAKAAQQGNVLAMLSLANAFHEGNGVKVSTVNAYVLIREAARIDPDAKELLKDAQKKLTEQQLDKAVNRTLPEVLAEVLAS